MSDPKFYGAGFPYRQIGDLPGKLIVLEGSDGVGRSTQIQMLRRWLEDEGFAVSDTGLRRSEMTQKGLGKSQTRTYPGSYHDEPLLCSRLCRPP